MTSRKLFVAEISIINIFHITQYFLVKSYKRNQWNLPDILAYISGIFDGFFKAGLAPLKLSASCIFSRSHLIKILILKMPLGTQFLGEFSNVEFHHLLLPPAYRSYITWCKKQPVFISEIMKSIYSYARSSSVLHLRYRIGIENTLP